MSQNVLSVKGLQAGYGRAEVLHSIDLHAPKGSVITVIGPNGAGKSTFLNARRQHTHQRIQKRRVRGACH